MIFYRINIDLTSKHTTTGFQMKARLLLGSVLAAASMSHAYAAMLTNNIVGVGPSSSPINPYVCIQNGSGAVQYALAPGQSVDANKMSGNLYYVGATLRFGGCSPSDSYLGYLGISLNDQHNNKISTYTPPDGVHIAYTNQSIDSDGKLTGNIQYTPIQPNFNMTKPAAQNATWDFVGANLSGLEFGKVIDPFVIPNLSVEDASSSNSDLSDTTTFIQSGMNTIRVPLSWGYLQLDGPGKGDINADYYNSYVKPLLETLTSAHVNAIVDLHAYMRYSQFGKEYSGCGADGACPDGTLITDPAAYQDVWSKLYQLMKNDNKIDMNYIMMDLVNEPVGAPDDSVFTIQAQVIKSLRQQGFQGYILVEGNSWTGMHSWNSASWTSSDGKTTYTNATLFTRDHFAQAGITDLSKIVINVHQYLDSDFSGTHDQCISDLSSMNGDAFVQYLQQNKMQAMVTEFGAGTDSSSCANTMNLFMQFLKANSSKGKDYGFLGWTIWSTGHGWGGYNLRVTPASYQMGVLKSYL